MSVPDVWDHYFAARQQRAMDMRWQLVSGRHGNPYLKSEYVRRDFDTARQYAITLDRRKSGWEVGTPENRIIQIGGELWLKTRDKFRERHPEALAWLATQGCTEGEAVLRFVAQMEQEQQHAFWRKKSSGRRRVVKSVVVKRRTADAGVIQDNDRDG